MTAMRRPTAAGRARTSGGRNQVRIIAGKWRSRILRFPDSASIRPTPDRVRETLFNWLGQRLDGLSCLDLFAGSGALGFEALSRGAARAVMVEQSREIAHCLTDNARALECAEAEIVTGDALAYLERSTDAFDVVFVDPPYASDLAPRVLEALPRHLKPDARVYVESGAPLAPPPPWRVVREDRAGAVRYALLDLSTP